MGKTIKNFDKGFVVELETPTKWRDAWVVIISKDEARGKYIGVPEKKKGQVDCGTKIEFEDKDVRMPIGTLTEDFAGIGEARHVDEVAPLIKDALKRCT